jgi:sRNA-binding carbon storage regulator CsrA
MLVLSRGINEAVVLADQVIITLVGLMPNSVELTLQATEGGPSALLAVELGEFIDVGLGARLTLVEVREGSACVGTCCGGPKARLGFETPTAVRVYRKEMSGVTRDPGSDWYFPKFDTTPSPN